MKPCFPIKKTCNGCAKCVELCPVAAMTLVSANDSKHPKRKVVRVDPQRCLGCGVCVAACKKASSLRLERRPRRVLTPLNTVHRSVIMAVERGKLRDLLFDNRVLWHHRALAAVIDAVLRLSPVRRAMATDQSESRYLEAMALRFS